MRQVFFGDRIKEIRENKMISQKELSRLSGIGIEQIIKIEEGKIEAESNIIEKLANVLKISIKEILLSIEHFPKPFVKWAGGKTQLLDKLISYLPNQFDHYFEPFVGGGSLFFALKPKKAVINDMNSELIYAYSCFQDDYLSSHLVDELKKYESQHSDSFYYQIRGLDREETFTSLPIYVRAARMIYLNKACFNGLYRVNSKGFFNVPSGKKRKVSTFDNSNFEAIKNYFKNSDITILNGDYAEAVKNATEGDFVYFDPPYDTWEDKDSFTSYSKDAFGKKEQIELANLFKQLSKRGVKVMLSNHNTLFINELYKDFNIHVVQAKRMINSNGSQRGEVDEVIITNY